MIGFKTQLVLAMFIACYLLYEQDSSPKNNNYIKHDDSTFHFPSVVGYQSHSTLKYGDEGAGIFVIHLRTLMSHDFLDGFDPAQLQKDAVVCLITYNGPSYADEATNALFMRMGHTTSPGQLLIGYDVVRVAADQDLYIAKDKEQFPKDIICFSNIITNSDSLSCSVRDSIERNKFPVKSDGRYPLVLTYSLPKFFLQSIPEIDKI